MDATRQAAEATGLSLVTLRALCLLIMEDGARAGSITVDVGREAGASLAVLRAARQVAREFGIRHVTELRAGRATVHVWRGVGETQTSTSPQYLAFQY